MIFIWNISIIITNMFWASVLCKLGIDDIIPKQNLVVNPSFEDTNICSIKTEVSDCYPCKNWWTPNLSTPDYYFKSSKFKEFQVPNTGIGLHYPKSGNAFIGLALFDTKTNYMEHIQGKLMEELSKGRIYEIKLWVKLAHQYSDFIPTNFGVYFSKDKVLSRNFNEITYEKIMNSTLTASVRNPPGIYISDTSWVEVSGKYKAIGGEKFITIGMFWDNNKKVVQAFDNAVNYPSIKNKKQLGKMVKKYIYKSNPLLNRSFGYVDGTLQKNGSSSAYILIDDVSVTEMLN